MAIKRFEEATKKCLEIVRNGGTALDLSGLGLTELPREIQGCSHIRTLNVSNNRLSGFPIGLLRFAELTKLDVGANPISELPDKIATLGKLRSLTLAFTHLPTVPSSLEGLRALE